MQINSVARTNQFLPLAHLGCKGFKGKFLHFFGQTIKISAPNNQSFYIEKKKLARALTGPTCPLASSQITKITQKFIEIAHPFNKKTLKLEEFESAFKSYDKPAENFEKVMLKLETLKQRSAPFTQFHYDTQLSELTNKLQAGDIIVRKYHEDNPNIICDLQKFFLKKGLREAYKCSHIAIYLGEIDGKPWLAEAVLPNDNDPQVRRVRLDDPRLELKEKNQYLVFRNQDSKVAQEAARIAGLYSLKMLPANEVPSTKNDKDGAFKYGHVEALRSLWHSSKFDLVAKHRLFKYYSDYANGVPLQYITNNRMLFCSQFILFSTQMAELKNSPEFLNIMKKHKPPVSSENRHSGVAKFFARISYVVRRAFWSRFMAVKFSKQMNQIIKTKVDFLRSSPQDTVNHLLNNKNYQVVGVINRKADQLS